MTELYTVSEMAHLFGLSRQTLIYYDRIGLFKPAQVNEEGYRFYAPTQIPLLRLICLLRDMGVELKEIERVLVTPDPARIAACLTEQLDALDAQISRLRARRSNVVERLEFYREAERWKADLGCPKLVHYPERFVAIEPFPAGAEVGRGVLHLTLMRILTRLREQADGAPVRGWGTVLRQEALRSPNPLAGGGPFVVVPAGIDPAQLTGVRVLPEGIYLCASRWGMPYDFSGVRGLVRFMDDRGLHACGDAFDFCLMDTTCYDEVHREDFCCLQIPVEV